MPALPSSAASTPPAAPTPTMTTSAFPVAITPPEQLPSELRLFFCVTQRSSCIAELRHLVCSGLDQLARVLPVLVHDRVGGHVGERLDRERRVVARRGREVGAADDEQIGD